MKVYCKDRAESHVYRDGMVYADQVLLGCETDPVTNEVMLLFKNVTLWKVGDVVYRDSAADSWYAKQLTKNRAYVVTAVLDSGYVQLAGFMCPVYSGWLSDKPVQWRYRLVFDQPVSAEHPVWTWLSNKAVELTHNGALLELEAEPEVALLAAALTAFALENFQINRIKL